MCKSAMFVSIADGRDILCSYYRVIHIDLTQFKLILC